MQWIIIERWGANQVEKTVLLVDQAYEDIKNMICNFELIPGQIVSDFTLSKKMGMSRTPIR